MLLLKKLPQKRENKEEETEVTAAEIIRESQELSKDWLTEDIEEAEDIKKEKIPKESENNKKK